MDARKAAILSRIRAPLKTQNMLAEVSNISVGESGAGRPQVIAGLAPVVDGRPVRDLSLQFYVGLPTESDSPGELQNIRRKGYGFLRATNPEFPTYPKKVGRDAYRLADGTVVPYKQTIAVSAAVDEAVFAALTKIREGGDSAVAGLKGTRVFMQPQAAEFDTESLKTTQFVKFIAAELNDSEPYLTSEVVDEGKQAEFLQAAGL